MLRLCKEIQLEERDVQHNTSLPNRPWRRECLVSPFTELPVFYYLISHPDCSEIEVRVWMFFSFCGVGLKSWHLDSGSSIQSKRRWDSDEALMAAHCDFCYLVQLLKFIWGTDPEALGWWKDGQICNSSSGPFLLGPFRPKPITSRLVL